ncbi:GGDEF domain-containing protein [Terricaulis sp.]|uniref:GGDEF domain-containing protein n=1 Tax=Terricaulis sp. TaxID=2768686 RepID=UPI003783C76A
MADGLNRFRGEAGVALARNAIDELARQAAPTSPANYEIWTTYLTGANPALNREIDERVKAGGAITDQVSEELFERYFARTRLSAKMLEATAGVARELDDVVTSLRSSGALAGGYADELHGAATRIENGADPAGLHAIVTGLAAATRKMAEHNRSLETQMQASSKQVESLQATLHEVRVEALTDGLTGLANRKHFDQSLEKLAAESASARSDLCLVICDIDHFKRVNDTWGHQVGDQVIRFVASVLRGHAEGDRLSARYGGEEFALILPRTDLHGAAAVAEQIRRTVSERKLSRRSTGDVIGQVTLSFGVAQFEPGESAADWLARADRCLYASKAAGRDRVTVQQEQHKRPPAAAA